MAALGVAEFTELVAATLRNYESEVFDNVTLRHPILSLVEGKRKDETGRAMVKNLELAENTSTGHTDESGSFSSTVSDPVVGSAVYEWCEPLVSHVRLKWMDIKKASGKEAIFELVKTHIRSMEKAHRKQIAKELHAVAAAGVGTQRQAGWINSLDLLTGDATYDTAQSIQLGGIDSTATPVWQASRIESPSTSGEVGYLSIRKAMRYIENEVYVNTDGMHEVDAIVAGRDIFEEFEDSFDGGVQYDSFEKGEARFKQISHGGKIVRLDPDCPPNRAYFLSTPALRFSSLAGAFMETQEAQRVPNTLDWVHPVASVMAFGTVERRAAAVLLRPATAGAAA